MSEVRDDLTHWRPQTFRSTGQTLVSVVFLLGIIALLLAQLLHAGDASGKIVGWVFVALLVLLVVRALLWSVRTDIEGVRIRGMLRTHRLRWAEIDRFSLGRHGLFPVVGIAHRKHGRPLAMSAIEVPKMASDRGRDNTEAIIAELNRLLVEQQRAEALQASEPH